MSGRARWAVLVAAALAAGHAATWLGSGPCDDDFICYRYARNWVAGDGLVFNVGERFEGFTNPLWVMLIALGMLLGLDPLALSLTLSILASGVAAWAVGELWRARYPEARWPVPALVVAALPAFAWHGVTGLGSTLLAALLALWLLSWDRARDARRVPWAAGVWLALACLLRQECALFALPFAWAEGLGRGRSGGGSRGSSWGLGAAALPLVALAGWTLFRFLYYGRLLPLSYHVKRLPLGVDLGYGLGYLWRSTQESGVALLVLLAPLCLRGARGGRRTVRRAALAAVALHTAYVVFVGGDFMALGRFFVPTLPLMVLLACEAVREGWRAPAARAALTLAALLLPQHLQFDWTWSGRRYRFIDNAFMEQRWASLGRHFGAVVSSRTKVALSPIGAFGYYSGLPIVDILGLTHAAALDEPPALDSVGMKGHHRFDGPWVLDQRPEFVILGNGVRVDGVLWVNPWEATVLSDPRFQQGYVQMRAPIPGGEPVDVFKRADVPPLPGSVLVRRRQ